MITRKGVERAAARILLFLSVCWVLQSGLSVLWAVEGTAQENSALPRPSTGDAFVEDGAGDGSPKAKVSETKAPRELEGDRDAVSTSSAEKVAAFLEPGKNKVFLPSYVSNRLSEAELPALYAALRDKNHAREWNSAVLAICVLEEDEKALDVVKAFVSTPWDWRAGNRHGQDARLVVRGIVNSVVNLAMLDSAVSGPFLADIFTRDGAERFLENWDGYDYPEGGTWDLLVEDLMFSAASGLIHTRVPEYNALVENQARVLHAIPKTKRTGAQTSHLVNCCQLLGWRMLYDEMGWDEGIEYTNTLNSESAFNLSNRYTGKYIRYLNDTSEVVP